MKIQNCLTLLLCLPLSLISKPEGVKEGAKKSGGFPSRGEIMKKFDTNNDGKLSEEERSILRQEMGGRAGGLPPLVAQKFDKDGDGKLNDEERASLRKEMITKGRKLPPPILGRFDKDGDGQISDEERTSLKKAWEDRKKTILEKFDADGDGRLNPEERKQAMVSFRNDAPNVKVPAGEENVEKGMAEKTGKKKGGESGKKGQGKKPKEKKKDS